MSEEDVCVTACVSVLSRKNDIEWIKEYCKLICSEIEEIEGEVSVL